MVSHLVNIDDTLAVTVAGGLGIEVPDAAEPARAPVDLDTSDALSIVLRRPVNFKGRKLGILATDGADAKVFTAHLTAFKKEGAICELVAPKIAGVTLSDGTVVPAKQKVDGGPSVLFDAVAVVVSESGVETLVKDAPSQDFVRDAFAHCKFIAYTPEALPLLAKAGLAEDLDEACLEITTGRSVTEFAAACRTLRL